MANIKSLILKQFSLTVLSIAITSILGCQLSQSPTPTNSTSPVPSESPQSSVQPDRPTKEPTIGTVDRMENGDLMCYVTLIDENNVRHESIGANFDLCENPNKYLNRKVRVTYELENVNDCQSAEPCGKTRQEWLINKMEILENSSSSHSQMPSQSDRNSNLAGELTQGDWIQRGDGSNTVLMFGGQNSEPRLLFRCDAASKQILVEKAQYLPDGQPIQIDIITPTGNNSYQATASNEVLPNLSFAIDIDDPFLQKLAETKDRFAVVPQTGNQLLLPATPKVQALIESCR